MAYLGYKNKIFREYKAEQEKIRMWKKAEAKKRKDLRNWIKANESKKKKLKEWSSVAVASIIHLALIVLLIVFYGLFASALISDSKADTIKVGDGPFVLAVSYTESYKDLQYVANFGDCETAMTYFHAKCNKAPIAMCQLEDKMYMPVNHNSVNTFSTFDFEVDDSQSCGFVKTQAGYSTFIED